MAHASNATAARITHTTIAAAEAQSLWAEDLDAAAPSEEAHLAEASVVVALEVAVPAQDGKKLNSELKNKNKT